MAQRQRRQDPLTALTLQIPKRAGAPSGSPQVLQIPNGYQFELNGVKINITSTVTPNSQMINLSINLDNVRPRRK